MLNLLTMTLFAMLIGLGFRRSKPADYEITNADRIKVVLTAFAALGTGTSFWRVMELPVEILWPERVAMFITSAALFAAPLFLYLAATRMQRQLKAARSQSR